MVVPVHRLTVVAAIAFAWAVPMAVCADPAKLPQDGLYQAAISAIAAGEYEQAVAQLEMLMLEAPEHAGARLDLAILFCQSGARERAFALFSHVESQFSPSPAIKELIARYRASGCQHSRLTLPRLRVSMGMGYDSNARLGSSLNQVTLGTPDNPFEVTLAQAQRAQASPFAGIQAEITYPVTSGTEVFGHIQKWNYSAADDVDSTLWSVGVSHAQPLWNGGRLELSAALAEATLGGEPFHRNMALRANLPLLPPQGGMPGFSLDGGYTTYQFKLNPLFDSSVWMARSHFLAPFGPGQQDFSFGLISDRAEAQRPGGNRHGWVAQWQAEWPTSGGYRWELLLREQQLRSSEIYSPGLIEKRRESTSQQAGAAFSIPSGLNQELRLQLRYQLGRDSIALFRYESLASELTWSWAWR